MCTICLSAEKWMLCMMYLTLSVVSRSLLCGRLLRAISIYLNGTIRKSVNGCLPLYKMSKLLRVLLLYLPSSVLFVAPYHHSKLFSIIIIIIRSFAFVGGTSIEHLEAIRVAAVSISSLNKDLDELNATFVSALVRIFAKSNPMEFCCPPPYGHLLIF